ncbi:MAG: CRTAC1 family protein [Planctomycetota bacterium]
MVDEADWVPGDDAVIGRALKISFVVLALAAAGVGTWLALRSKKEAPPPASPPVVAPPRLQAPASAAPDMPFRDVSMRAGVEFVHHGGASGEKLLPETMGAGAAFFDLEGDGDADLLLVNGTPWRGQAWKGERPRLALYVNDGQGQLQDVTQARGLAIEHQGTGVAVADADGDGDPDVFLPGLFGDRWFRNDGGMFVDATAEAGLGGGTDGWSTSAGFFDADQDGDLDLFVSRYVMWSPEIDREVGYTLLGLGRAYGPPTNFRGAHSLLYRNDGGGRFTEVGEAAGLHVANPATGVAVGKALALTFVDVDEDGRLDVFVANDTTRNFLFHNLGGMKFAEIGEEAGVAYDARGGSTGAMGVDAADVRDDGCVAIAVGNFASEPSSLYMNRPGALRFHDASIVEGVGAPSRLALSFGVLFLDVDLDGRLDLFQTNGHLEEEIGTVQPSQSYRQSSQLFWNAGPKAAAAYALVPDEKVGDLALPVVGRGVAAADIDGDGDLDLVLTQRGDRALLLRNDQRLGHHWLRVRLVGRGPNTDAIGATVRAVVDGRTLTRRVMPTRSYLSQCELPVTFGLGLATTVASLEVIWPDGATQRVEVADVDREIVVRRE